MGVALSAKKSGGVVAASNAALLSKFRKLQMNLSLIICIVTGVLVCASVVFEWKLRLGKVTLGVYWITSLVGAAVCLAVGVVPMDYVANGLVANTAVNPLKILALFLSMTLLSVYLDELGVFRYLAEHALAHDGGSQIALFCKLYALVAVLTVFTSNDIIVLTFTPFICCFCRRAEIDPIPYLFAEFFAANTWSMFLIIGNPTNIYLATSVGVTFAEYFCVMALPTLVGGIVSFGVLLAVFERRLRGGLQTLPVSSALSDKTAVAVGVAHLAVCIVSLAVSSYIGVEMWLVTLVLAASLCVWTLALRLFGKHDISPLAKSFARLPYELVPFVLSMFVLVLALQYNGDTDKLATLLSKGDPVWTVGTSGFLVANVINNIPMSVLYSAVTTSSAFVGSAATKAVYAAVVASNLGAYFTPVGALAGIMWLNILKKENAPIGFGTFVKYGSLVALPTLAATLAVLSLMV